MKSRYNFGWGSASPEHFTNGGTAITNFRPAQEALYRAAIIKSNMEEVLAVGPPTSRGNPEDKALHYIKRGKHSDLSAFWDVFHDLQKEMEP